MGKRPAARQGSPRRATTADLPTNAGHPFFERLNRVLEKAEFDAFVEGLCAVFYATRMGRPSLRPGRYFRKRVLVQAACCNLGLLLRHLTGIGTPRGPAGAGIAGCLTWSDRRSLS